MPSFPKPIPRSPSEVLSALLTERQILPQAKVLELAASAAARGVQLTRALVDEGLLSREDLFALLENHYFCPHFDLRSWSYDPAPLWMIPQRLAYRHRLFPIEETSKGLRVAFADPDDLAARAAVSQAVSVDVLRSVTLEEDILTAIEQHYGRLTSEGQVARPAEPVRAAPKSLDHNVRALSRELTKLQTIEAVERILQVAAERRATDIHFESRELCAVVRLRIDGILQEVARLPVEYARPMTTRFKVMAEMDISDRRVPQDGRASCFHGKTELDLRLSSIPSQFGEKIVVRLLRKQLELLDLDRLEMPPVVRNLHQDMIQNPLGIFLVTGPTGSGKTTTLYATLAALDRERLNVVTLEDPIEYSFDDLTQVQINESAGVTFASGLESILRQDPDVILLGEIRSRDSLEIAARAALTGHKVFSTLHTNDSTQAITRLVDMGAQPYVVTATVRAVIAQRLLRRICEACRESYAPNQTERAILGYAEVDQLHRGVGCDECSRTGYHGRMAVYEYFRLDESLHRLVIERAPSQVLRQAALANGMVPMSQFAIRAVIEGKTTVAEIQRVVLSDEAKETLCSGCQRIVNSEFSSCPFCQQTLKESCGCCGRSLESNWQSCPGCGSAIEREWQRVFCKHCIAPLDPSWDGCPFCGESKS